MAPFDGYLRLRCRVVVVVRAGSGVLVHLPEAEIKLERVGWVYNS